MKPDQNDPNSWRATIRFLIIFNVVMWPIAFAWAYLLNWAGLIR